MAKVRIQALSNFPVALIPQKTYVLHYRTKAMELQGSLTLFSRIVTIGLHKDIRSPWVSRSPFELKHLLLARLHRRCRCQPTTRAVRSVKSALRCGLTLAALLPHAAQN